MKKYLSILMILSVLVACVQAKAYYGRNSTEAVLRFDAVLETKWDGSLSLNQWNVEGETRKQALTQVQNQVIHLIGTFQTAEFAKRWGGPASIGPWFEPNTFSVKFTDVQPQQGGRVRVKYVFESTIAVQKDPLRRKKTRQIDIWMPVAPDKIYDLGVKWNKNQCTDKTENEAKDFYYFWDPFQKNCSLIEKHPETIQWISANIERLDNTKRTYPEYDLVYKDKLNKPTLKIAMFWGYIATHIRAKKPYYRDEGFQAMKVVSSRLEAEGFEELEYRPHFHIGKNGEVIESAGANVFRKMRKVVQRNGKDLTIEIVMLLSDSEADAKDPTFRTYVKPALNQADIFIYDGHSGDGEVLDPVKLKLAPPQAKKYQIFFINACDVYMNYVEKFRSHHGGFENLDLVISGTPTTADASTANDWTFLEPFISVKTLSYQAILDRLEKSNGKGNGTFLVGVKGDENNRWRPQTKDGDDLPRDTDEELMLISSVLSATEKARIELLVSSNDPESGKQNKKTFYIHIDPTDEAVKIK